MWKKQKQKGKPLHIIIIMIIIIISERYVPFPLFCTSIIFVHMCGVCVVDMLILTWPEQSWHPGLTSYHHTHSRVSHCSTACTILPFGYQQQPVSYVGGATTATTSF